LKIAVFSDVHSNLEAYRASLMDMARRPDVERLWCLGDIVGYGAEPELCVGITAALAGDAPPPDLDAEFAGAVERLAGRLGPVVLGNHDAAAFGDRIVNYFSETARTAAHWTTDQISSRARLFLQNLPLTAAEGDKLLVHATPVRPREFHYVLSAADARQVFAATDAHITFFGHTHQPTVLPEIAIPGGGMAPGGLAAGRCLVNVGSVGQPRDRDPRACYVLYDPEEAGLEFVRVEYDVETAARKITEAGLPAVLAERLHHGW
jgi:diadenosine tetraphosphatase ApaH/serine/threonine PP2A family protein phosphatase